MRPLIGLAAAQVPLAAVVPHALGWPWWALLPAALAWPAAYICRTILVFRLGSKALDKGGQDQAPAIMAAITGHNPDQPGKPRGG